MFETVCWRLGYGRRSLPDRSIQELKTITRILFVDDGAFDVPGILRDAGWRHTKMIKDVQSLDQTDIVDAHIIFVDIKGVGRQLRFAQEGLGLLSALKEKYPEKKIIVYSSQRQGDRFHKGLSDADARLYKNADPYQFEAVIEEFSLEAFSLSGCVGRLQKHLRDEFRLTISTDDICVNILKIQRKGDFSETYVSKVFNLQNAGSVASIVGLFLSARTW